jgi:4-hydroxybenzoate polyprenyltransferase
MGDINQDKEAIWGTIHITFVICYHLCFLDHTIQKHKFWIRLLFVILTGIGISNRIYDLKNLDEEKAMIIKNMLIYLFTVLGGALLMMNISNVDQEHYLNLVKVLQ